MNGNPVETAAACSAARPPPSRSAIATRPSKQAQNTRCASGASTLPPAVMVSITSEPEVGHIYKGKVVKIVDFGAFVNFFGSRDGLVHVSQLAPQRVQNVKDVVKEGDKVYVKFMGMDERGKVRLSMKVVDQQTGQEIKRSEGEAAA